MCEAAVMSGYTHTHTYIHTYTHTYIHTHTHTHTYVHTHTTTTTVNSLFSSWKYFRTHTLSENLLLGYYSTTKIFLQRNIISFVYLELKCAHVSDYSQNVSSPLFQAVVTRSQRIALQSATFCRYCLAP